MIEIFDFAILDFIKEYVANPFFDVFFKLITHIGDNAIFFIVLSVVCLFFKKTRKYGIALAIGLTLCLILCNITLKNLFARVRPFDVKNVALLINAPTDFSFPSGHTTCSFLWAEITRRFYKKLSIPAYILACLIAFSRLYLYVHYPTDIIGGIILGIAIGYAASKIVNRK
jgi:undecaprenyl-diphosphatase